MALFRKLMNSGDAQAVAVAEDLDTQIARAQDVRQTLEALVTLAQAHIAQIPQVNASMEEGERRAADLGQRLEILAARVDDFENVRRQDADSRSAGRRSGRKGSAGARARDTRSMNIAPPSSSWYRWAGAPARASRD